MAKLMNRDQYNKWLKKLPKNYCTFCNWKEYQIVLKEGWRWIWVANLAPYWYWHTMLVPKRHFVEYNEMNDKEAVELRDMFDYAINRYREEKLLREDGSQIKKYVFFWRLRDDTYDPISKVKRPNHFHIQIAPDKDHLWDPTLDKNAYKIDIMRLK